ncbi:MAG: MerR family transcriptional regulator [Gallionella sp.]
MEIHKPNSELPTIPAKRYFTIGEVSDLCGVKAHVLRYWEQEFTQLKPLKRGGNRRYYQHHEVLLVRHIRELLYEQGFTINGARHRLEGQELVVLNEAQPETSPSINTCNISLNLPQLKHEIHQVICLLQQGNFSIKQP